LLKLGPMALGYVVMKWITFKHQSVSDLASRYCTVYAWMHMHVHVFRGNYTVTDFEELLQSGKFGTFPNLGTLHFQIRKHSQIQKRLPFPNGPFAKFIF
jgi:hypothetical protein